MKKTKILMALLSLSLFAFMALGSGSSEEESKEIVGSSENAGKENDGGNKENTKKDVSIQEQVLLDKSGIKITATKYQKDSIWGDGIALTIENNTDKTYTVGCDALIVNDFMISDLFVADVAAGKKANETMHLSSSALEAAGINSIGKIEMYFHAYDDNYHNLFKNEYSKIETSLFGEMDTTCDTDGTELYNKDGIRIIGKAVDENSFWGTAILLYIENNSNANIGVNVDDFSINGYMIDPVFSSTIFAGKKAYDDITLFEADLEDNHIESIENVELKFHIYNTDNYKTIADSDVITFSTK